VSRVLGVILIALGLFGLAWGGFSYTTREKVVDIRPIHATRDQTHNCAAAPHRGRRFAHCRRGAFVRKPEAITFTSARRSEINFTR
jgi:hypothetical protein